MADFQAKAGKLLLRNDVRCFRESGTAPAEAVAPAACPELAKPFTEIDESDIDA